MSKTADNIAKVRVRIQQAAEEGHRDADSIRLLAVSKAQGATKIREAYIAGIRDFGENYAQEAEAKISELTDLPITWHFIGPLQSNKVRLIAERFTWLHSLDRLKIAERLSRERKTTQPPLQVCIQVNIDHETGKSGIDAAELPGFAAELIKLPHLQLRGVMAIPRQPENNSDQSLNQLRCAFADLRHLFQQLQKQFPQLPIDTLSMGMSADLELAIAEGSTLVRIGSDIFGARS